MGQTSSTSCFVMDAADLESYQEQAASEKTSSKKTTRRAKQKKQRTARKKHSSKHKAFDKPALRSFAAIEPEPALPLASARTMNPFKKSKPNAKDFIHYAITAIQTNNMTLLDLLINPSEENSSTTPFVDIKTLTNSNLKKRIEQCIIKQTAYATALQATEDSLLLLQKHPSNTTPSITKKHKNKIRKLIQHQPSIARKDLIAYFKARDPHYLEPDRKENRFATAIGKNQLSLSQAFEYLQQEHLQAFAPCKAILERALDHSDSSSYTRILSESCEALSQSMQQFNVSIDQIMDESQHISEPYATQLSQLATLHARRFKKVTAWQTQSPKQREQLPKIFHTKDERKLRYAFTHGTLPAKQVIDDTSGDRLSHIAARSLNFPALLMLANRGASLINKNRRGETAKSILLKSPELQQAHPRIIALLNRHPKDMQRIMQEFQHIIETYKHNNPNVSQQNIIKRFRHMTTAILTQALQQGQKFQHSSVALVIAINGFLHLLQSINIIPTGPRRQSSLQSQLIHEARQVETPVPFQAIHIKRKDNRLLDEEYRQRHPLRSTTSFIQLQQHTNRLIQAYANQANQNQDSNILSDAQRQHHNYHALGAVKAHFIRTKINEIQVCLQRKYWQAAEQALRQLEHQNINTSDLAMTPPICFKSQNNSEIPLSHIKNQINNFNCKSHRHRNFSVIFNGYHEQLVSTSPRYFGLFSGKGQPKSAKLVKQFCKQAWKYLLAAKTMGHTNNNTAASAN